MCVLLCFLLLPLECVVHVAGSLLCSWLYHHSELYTQSVLVIPLMFMLKTKITYEKQICLVTRYLYEGIIVITPNIL